MRNSARLLTAPFFLIGGLVLSLLLSCKGAAEETSQLPEEDLRLLTEALIIEANLQDIPGLQKDTLEKLWYGQLYDRFGTDEQGLNALRNKLSANPTLWARTMDTLSARLDRHRNSVDSLISN